MGNTLLLYRQESREGWGVKLEGGAKKADLNQGGKQNRTPVSTHTFRFLEFYSLSSQPCDFLCVPQKGLRLLTGDYWTRAYMGRKLEVEGSAFYCLSRKDPGLLWGKVSGGKTAC